MEASAIVSENAAAELRKLEREEKDIADRIANDQARLTVITASKAALSPLIQKDAPKPAPTGAIAAIAPAAQSTKPI